jgi:hypothetical protein
MLPADFEEQAIELENQEALEVIQRTETTEIHQIEAALTPPRPKSLREIMKEKESNERD